MYLYNELAEYYFAIENNHRDFNNDISLLRSELHGIKEPSLLDLGCGTGEHLERLSRYGIKCTGIDISENMLSVAKKRFPNKINFLKKDITDFDFFNEFNFITSLFGSMDYLIEDSDLESAFWNMWRALKENGTGLIEIWNSLPIEQIRSKPVTRVSTTKYNDVIIERERGFNKLNIPGKTIVEVNYKYNITNSVSSKTVNDRHIMRAFTTDEISKFILDNGFYIKAIYANSIKDPYNENSNKMLVHFIKE